MEEDTDWKTLAMGMQMQFFETLGSRSYDEIEKTNLFLLRKKVGFATCGKPKELPSPSNLFIGYGKTDLDQIKKICDKIIEKSEFDPIHFACTVLVLYHNKSICETSVFRIESKTGDIFIDAHGRVYQSWKMFMEENKLPDCEYCYPQEGKYLNEKNAQIGFAFSPASTFFSKAADYLDTAGTVASVAAATVFAVGTFFTIAPVVAAAAGTSAACTGVYSISRNVSSLLDRNKHEQSVGLRDPESRSAWLAVGSSILGVATFGAIGKAQKVVESGESLSKFSVYGLHALTTSSLVFSGFGFVETLIICVDKYQKGVLTKKDVFDLSCELLFLFNAIASAKATTNLVNNMSAAAAETPAIQKKLTKTQKRNLRKRAAKRRAKGLSPYTDTSSDSTTDSVFKSTISFLLLEAVKMYSPRAEEVMYNCQSIFHDILCWKRKEISDSVFFRNAFQRMLRLFNDYRDEILEAMVKVVKYFSSFNLNKIMDDIYRFFCEASEELKNIFCTRVINLEDQIEVLINDAERDVSNLHEELGLEVEESTTENSLENSEDLQEDDFNSETQNLLSSCGNLISVSALPCRDLDDFGDILDAVKYVVVSDFKTKMSNYKMSLEAAKAASGDSFNVTTFHKALGINGEVGQHMFGETMQNLTADCTIYKIKNKCKETKKERSNRSTPIWEGVNDGMFHYYGPHGSGSLARSDLLSIVNGIVTEADVTEKNCKIVEDKDTMMIEVQVQDKEEINVVVYQGVTEENTAFGMILVMK